jgi:O-Antigen ligase
MTRRLFSIYPRQLHVFLTDTFLLWSFLYVVVGNAARIVPLEGFRDNLLLSEFFLYLFTLINLLLIPRLLSHLIQSFGLLFSLILVSFFFGSFLNGFEITPSLYAIRLILMLSSGFVLGYHLWQRNNNDTNKIHHVYSLVSLTLVLIGLIIYVAFPDSAQLWRTLATYGITFNGDPHERRFVSSYFDPNFYSVIACLGLITSYLAFRFTQKKWYLMITLLILFSIVLSGSRSGIATVFCIAPFIAYQIVKRVLAKRIISLRLFLLAPFVIVGIMALSPSYVDSITRVWQRIVKPDQSAMLRVESFTIGQELLSEQPIFGVGYNYLFIYAKEFRGRSSVDSSLQATLINFGILGTATILAMLVWFFTRLHQELKKIKGTRGYENLQLSLWFIHIYITVVVIFASQFNNILYYQFWLVPVIALYTYFWFNVKEANLRQAHQEG